MQQVTLAIRIGLGLLAVMLVAPIQAAAQQRTVLEELLDIMKARDQISDTEYKALKARAKQEEIQRRKEIEREIRGAPVPPPPVQKAAPAPKAPAAPAAPAVQEAAAKPKAPASATPTGDAATFKAYWKEGLRFENADGNFKMRIGGRIQLDGAMWGPSRNLQDELDFDSFESGVEFRRARLYTEGIIYKDFGFKFEYDFADQAFKDVYFDYNDVPGVQQIRAGHFKEPLSLEELTSDNFTTFMERGLPNAFSPSRKTGIGTNMTFFEDDRVVWGLGAFRGNTNSSGFAFGGEQAYDITTRVAGTPWYDDNSNLLLLSLGASHQFRSNFELSYSSRPEAHLVPRVIDTDDLITDGVNLVDPAIALVLGPFSAQAEYIQTYVDVPDAEDPQFFGWYGYVSYFVTGESRGYRPEEAAFSRVTPKNNFGWASDSGWGAFELAVRQSQLNLNSAGINGGRLNDTTFGVNWYLNPNMRVTANYIYANRTPASSGNVYQARLQVDY